MKRGILLLVVSVLLSLQATATSTLSGNLKTLGAAGSNGTGIKIRFELRSNDVNGKTQLGCGPGNLPRVSGVGPLDDTQFDFTVSNTGVLAGTLYRTDTEIDCGGGQFVSYYWVYIIKNGQKTYYGQFVVNASTFDLNTAPQAIMTGIGLSPSGFVDLASTQTISGQKNFTAQKVSAKRFSSDQASPLVAGDITLGAGWGSTASVGSVIGHDSSFAFTITSSGTGQATATSNITVTFHDGTWTNTPICLVIFHDPAFPLSSVLFQVTESATAPVWNNYNDLPISGRTYRVEGRCEGR